MIYLLSTSPRRKKILREAGIRFKTFKPDYQEKKIAGLSVSALVRAHAAGKGLSALSRIADGIILSADTVVSFRKKIIGKPRDMRDALRILSLLQGQWHTVYTGVTVLRVSGGKIKKKDVFVERTRIKIYPMDAQGIRRYFKKINPLDKAGAYAIQSKHSIVEEFKGLHSNAVGLPIEKIRPYLKA